MYQWLSKKLFGSPTERTLKKLKPLVVAVNALEPSVKALTNDQLRAKTAEFREKLAQGAAVEDILFEAFAVVREASAAPPRCATSTSSSSEAPSSTRG